jgi:uncharacterized protein YjiS (DUF1127 family)
MSRITAPRPADRLWPYAQPTRGLAARPAWHRIASTVARWIAAMRERQRLHRAEYELHLLNDRMLEDIGLRRSEIASMVRWGHASRTKIQQGMWI